jgi:hypothetical protein
VFQGPSLTPELFRLAVPQAIIEDRRFRSDDGTNGFVQVVCDGTGRQKLDAGQAEVSPGVDAARSGKSRTTIKMTAIASGLIVALDARLMTPVMVAQEPS